MLWTVSTSVVLRKNVSVTMSSLSEKCSSTGWVGVTCAIKLTCAEMHDAPTDVRKMAQKLISVFQYEARVKRLTLSLDMADSFERLNARMIMTDHVRLGQV